MRENGLDWPLQRLHRLVFEQSPEPTLVVDDEGAIVMRNLAASGLRGIDVDAMFGADTAPAEVREFLEALRSDGRASRELSLDAGSRRWLTLEGRALEPAYLVTVRDTTEARRDREELRRLRRLEATGMLTAALAHDLNNVLTSVVCAGSVMRKQLERAAQPVGLAADIVADGERAAGIVRRVMRLLRRAPSRPRRLSISAAVAEMRSVLELVVGPSIEIVADLRPDLPDACIEPELLDHVLVHLATGAREAMPEGGTLTLCTRTASADGQDYVSLVVAETGQGISSDVHERASELVARAGGLTRVHGSPGQGTTTIVYFRAAPPLAPIIALPSANRPEPRASEVILVIEPDDRVRGALRAVLRDIGYRVVDVPAGALAARQVHLSGLRVDLVLADVSARGPAGPEVAAALRRAGHPARTLLMSGGTETALEAMSAAGVVASSVLRKAFTPAELARRVREVLDETELAPGSSAR